MTAVCVVVQNVYDGDPRVRRKAEALAAAGYSVDVLALRPPTGRASYVLNGVNVRTLRLAKRRGSILRYLYEYAVFFAWVLGRTTWQMRGRRYAVIEVNTLPDFLIFSTVLAKWMGAALVLDLHEIAPEFFMSKYGLAERSLAVRVLKWLERASVAFADRVIVTSVPAEERFMSRGLLRTKSTVLLNSADEARASGAGASVAPPRRDPDAFVMLYHGTLTRGYGLDLAIDAFADAAREMPHAQLWILGSGPEAPNLQRLAAEREIGDRVKFLGQVPLEAIPAHLALADVGLLPIRSDVFFDFAFPNKLPEFIVAGVPVVVSRLPVLQRYFSEGAVTYVRPNDPADLARALLHCYRDRAQAAEVTARAKAEYAPIRWDVMKGRYLDLVRGLVKPDLETAATSLLAYCRTHDWVGADPYDALNSDRLATSPLIQSRWPRIVVTQLLRRSPVDVRSGMQMRPHRQATTLALFMSGLLRAPHLTSSNTGKEIDGLLAEILELRSPGLDQWCWGYGFPWQTRTVLVPRNAPNLVATVVVADALLDVYDARRDRRLLEIASSAAAYLHETLYWNDGRAAGFSYPTPSLRSEIHNANLLGAAFLLRVDALTEREVFSEAALRAARTAVQRQRPDGAWPYGESRRQQWVDSVHQGYDLCALHAIARHAGTTEFDDAIARGLQFYRAHFLHQTGAVRYFHNREFPIDIQGVAQAILTLVSLRDRDPDNLVHARAAADWAVRHMRDERGFFYYRRLRLGTIRISYMRWSQAWMFHALTSLSAASS